MIRKMNRMSKSEIKRIESLLADKTKEELLIIIAKSFKTIDELKTKMSELETENVELRKWIEPLREGWEEDE